MCSDHLKPKWSDDVNFPLLQIKAEVPLKAPVIRHRLLLPPHALCLEHPKVVPSPGFMAALPCPPWGFLGPSCSPVLQSAPLHFTHCTPICLFVWGLLSPHRVSVLLITSISPGPGQTSGMTVSKSGNSPYRDRVQDATHVLKTTISGHFTRKRPVVAAT